MDSYISIMNKAMNIASYNKDANQSIHESNHKKSNGGKHKESECKLVEWLYISTEF